MGVAVIIALLAYFILAGVASPEVLIPQDTTMSVPQGYSWSVEKGGNLQGHFEVANGSAEVCFADYDMFGYSVAHGLSFNQCPSNATYSSGFVTSGGLSGNFGPGVIYVQTFVPPGFLDSQPRLSVTWTSAVELIPN